MGIFKIHIDTREVISHCDASVNKDFFKDWSIDFKIANILESKDSALACLAVSYTDKDASGNTLKFSYWLSLLFHKNIDSGNWQLVFDQNTNIKEN